MSGNASKAVEIAAGIARPFEGLSLVPYRCPAGHWTIGRGTVYYPDGRKVAPDDPAITEAQADAFLLNSMMQTYLPGVLKASPLLAAFPGILGAITDFAYNLGVPRYRASTLRKRLEEQDWEGAIDELQRWVRGGGRVLPGLVKRRQAESLFLK